jgi:hypothetical protein
MLVADHELRPQSQEVTESQRPRLVWDESDKNEQDLREKRIGAAHRITQETIRNAYERNAYEISERH